MRTHLRGQKRLLALLLGLALAVAGCGNGDDDLEPGDAPDAGDEAAEEVEIVGVDYAFEGVPASVDAGTRLTFRNDAESEPHELVVFKIAEGEDRSIVELLELPEDEAQVAAEFRGVAIAFPGEEPFFPEGDIDLSEPGRYGLVCFFPVGADAEALRELMEAEEEPEEEPEGPPPGLGDGPPHFTEGMFAELTVT